MKGLTMKDLIFYHIFPLGAFVDDETEHGILEVKEWIPHIKGLGANAIYFLRFLSPAATDMIRKIIK